MIGTLVNAITVFLGSVVGITLKKEMPERIRTLIFQAVGLFTLSLGFIMTLKMKNPIIIIISLILASITGGIIGIEDILAKSAEKIKRKIGGSEKFVEGLITSFITFCVGPMTVIGSIEDGLGDPSILIAKSIMDGVVSIAYSVVYGYGVIFSIIPLFIYQGSLTLLAQHIKTLLSDALLYDLTATGGILLIGLGISLLEIRKIKVGDLLSSLLITPLLTIIIMQLNVTL